MAKPFNLTAQLNVTGPVGLRPVISSIKKQLSGITTNVNVKLDQKASRGIKNLNRDILTLNKALKTAAGDASSLSASMSKLGSSLRTIKSSSAASAKGLSSVGKSAQQTGKELAVAKTEMEEFGRISGLALRRYAGFTVATTITFGFVRAMSNAMGEALRFERELIKVAQVTGSTMKGVRGLADEVGRLSVKWGVASKDLLEVSRVLAQTGMNANEVKTSLNALAKSSLAPTFRDMKSTVEGAIAAMSQFGLKAKDMEAMLGSINAVAGKFAVEAEDIISAIRRTGGVFKAAAGDIGAPKKQLNELIAIFTSVRATTRESAESIATGLRTIFTRIQRPRSIQFLKELGIEVQDLSGKFVGPYEAIRRLSTALKTLDPRDVRFAKIVEELGGFRQVGKLIPAIQQFGKAQSALKVAMAGQDSLAKDAAQAQKSLLVQAIKVREEFNKLFRTVAQSTSFRVVSKSVLQLASSFIKLAEAVTPVLPFLTLIAGIKGAGMARGFGAGFLGGIGKAGGARGVGAGMAGAVTGQSSGKASVASQALATAQKAQTAATQSNTKALVSLTTAVGRLATRGFGGPRRGFSGGGLVPGTGNYDSVPADLTPGEFVIRKSSVKQLGLGYLQNANRMASGGRVTKNRSGYGIRLKKWRTTYDNVSSWGGKTREQLRTMNRNNPSAYAKEAEAAEAKWAASRDKAQGAAAAAEKKELEGLGRTKQRNITQLSISAGTAPIISMLSINPKKGKKDSAVSGTGARYKSEDAVRRVLTELNKTNPGMLPQDKDAREKRIDTLTANGIHLPISKNFLSKAKRQQFNDITREGVRGTVEKLIKLYDQSPGAAPGQRTVSKSLRQIGISDIQGKLFEAAVASMTRIIGTDDKARFDFDLRDTPPARLTRLANLFGGQEFDTEKFADAKLSASTSSLQSVKKKATSNKVLPKLNDLGAIQWKNKGGRISDTVPAMLTPGEFVINRESASKIGLGNLIKMNQGQVAGFASGGLVTPNRGNYGPLSGMATRMRNRQQMRARARRMRKHGAFGLDPKGGPGGFEGGAGFALMMGAPMVEQMIGAETAGGAMFGRAVGSAGMAAGTAGQFGMKGGPLAIVALGAAALGTIDGLQKFKENLHADEIATATTKLQKAFEQFSAGGSAESLEVAFKRAGQATDDFIKFQANTFGKRFGGIQAVPSAVGEFLTGGFMGNTARAVQAEIGTPALLQVAGASLIPGGRTGQEVLEEHGQAAFRRRGAEIAAASAGTGAVAAQKLEKMIRELPTESLRGAKHGESDALNKLLKDERAKVLEMAKADPESAAELARIEATVSDERSKQILIDAELNRVIKSQLRDFAERIKLEKDLAEAMKATGDHLNTTRLIFAGMTASIGRVSSLMSNLRQTMDQNVAAGQGRPVIGVPKNQFQTQFANMRALSGRERDRALQALGRASGVGRSPKSQARFDELTSIIKGSEKFKEEIPKIMRDVATMDIETRNIEMKKRISALAGPGATKEERDFLDKIGNQLAAKFTTERQGKSDEEIVTDPSNLASIDARQQDAEKMLQAFAKAVDQQREAVAKTTNQWASLELQARDSVRNFMRVRADQKRALAELKGERISIKDMLKPFEDEIKTLSGAQIFGSTTQDVHELAKRRSIMEEERRVLQARLNTMGLNESEQRKVNERLKTLSVAITENQTAMKMLASDTTRASAVMDKMAKFRQAREGARGFLERLLTSSREEEGQRARGQQIVQFVQAGGDVASLPVEDRKLFFATIREMKEAAQIAADADSPAGFLALKRIDELEARAFRRAFGPAFGAAGQAGGPGGAVIQRLIATAATPQGGHTAEQRLQSQLENIFDVQGDAAQLLAKQDIAIAKEFGMEAAKQFVVFERAMSAALSNLNKTGFAIKSWPKVPLVVRPGVGWTSSPKRVERNAGGIIPGTGTSDTVPAMLTPGEFVVNAAASQANLGLLQSINKQGATQRFAKGGRVAAPGQVLRFNGGGWSATEGHDEAHIATVVAAMMGGTGAALGVAYLGAKGYKKFKGQDKKPMTLEEAKANKIVEKNVAKDATEVKKTKAKETSTAAETNQSLSEKMRAETSEALSQDPELQRQIEAKNREAAKNANKEVKVVKETADEAVKTSADELKKAKTEQQATGRRGRGRRGSTERRLLRRRRQGPQPTGDEAAKVKAARQERLAARNKTIATQAAAKQAAAEQFSADIIQKRTFGTGPQAQAPVPTKTPVGPTQTTLPKMSGGPPVDVRLAQQPTGPTTTIATDIPTPSAATRAAHAAQLDIPAPDLTQPHQTTRGVHEQYPIGDPHKGPTRTPTISGDPGNVPKEFTVDSMKKYTRQQLIKIRGEHTAAVTDIQVSTAEEVRALEAQKKAIEAQGKAIETRRAAGGSGAEPPGVNATRAEKEIFRLREEIYKKGASSPAIEMELTRWQNIRAVELDPSLKDVRTAGVIQEEILAHQANIWREFDAGANAPRGPGELYDFSRFEEWKRKHNELLAERELAKKMDPVRAQKTKFQATADKIAKQPTTVKPNVALATEPIVITPGVAAAGEGATTFTVGPGQGPSAAGVPESTVFTTDTVQTGSRTIAEADAVATGRPIGPETQATPSRTPQQIATGMGEGSFSGAELAKDINRAQKAKEVKNIQAHKADLLNPKHVNPSLEDLNLASEAQSRFKWHRNAAGEVVPRSASAKAVIKSHPRVVAARAALDAAQANYSTAANVIRNLPEGVAPNLSQLASFHEATNALTVARHGMLNVSRIATDTGAGLKGPAAGVRQGTATARGRLMPRGSTVFGKPVPSAPRWLRKSFPYAASAEGKWLLSKIPTGIKTAGTGAVLAAWAAMEAWEAQGNMSGLLAAQRGQQKDPKTGEFRDITPQEAQALEDYYGEALALQGFRVGIDAGSAIITGGMPVYSATDLVAGGTAWIAKQVQAKAFGISPEDSSYRLEEGEHGVIHAWMKRLNEARILHKTYSDGTGLLYGEGMALKSERLTSDAKKQLETEDLERARLRHFVAPWGDETKMTKEDRAHIKDMLARIRGKDYAKHLHGLRTRGEDPAGVGARSMSAEQFFDAFLSLGYTKSGEKDSFVSAGRLFKSGYTFDPNKRSVSGKSPIFGGVPVEWGGLNLVEQHGLLTGPGSGAAKGAGLANLRLFEQAEDFDNNFNAYMGWHAHLNEVFRTVDKQVSLIQSEKGARTYLSGFMGSKLGIKGAQERVANKMHKIRELWGLQQLAVSEFSKRNIANKEALELDKDKKQARDNELSNRFGLPAGDPRLRYAERDFEVSEKLFNAMNKRSAAGLDISEGAVMNYFNRYRGNESFSLNDVQTGNRLIPYKDFYGSKGASAFPFPFEEVAGKIDPNQEDLYRAAGFFDGPNGLSLGFAPSRRNIPPMFHDDDAGNMARFADKRKGGHYWQGEDMPDEFFTPRTIKELLFIAAKDAAEVGMGTAWVNQADTEAAAANIKRAVAASRSRLEEGKLKQALGPLATDPDHPFGDGAPTGLTPNIFNSAMLTVADLFKWWGPEGTMDAFSRNILPVGGPTTVVRGALGRTNQDLAFMGHRFGSDLETLLNTPFVGGGENWASRLTYISQKMKEDEWAKKAGAGGFYSQSQVKAMTDDAIASYGSEGFRFRPIEFGHSKWSSGSSVMYTDPQSYARSMLKGNWGVDAMKKWLVGMGYNAADLPDTTEELKAIYNQGAPVRKNAGGRIPGTGTSDTVAAMLSPGEFVVNASATQANLGLLHNINKHGATQRFNAGGQVWPMRRYANGTPRLDPILGTPVVEDLGGPPLSVGAARQSEREADEEWARDQAERARRANQGETRAEKIRRLEAEPTENFLPGMPGTMLAQRLERAKGFIQGDDDRARQNKEQRALYLLRSQQFFDRLSNDVLHPHVTLSDFMGNTNQSGLDLMGWNEAAQNALKELNAYWRDQAVPTPMDLRVSPRLAITGPLLSKKYNEERSRAFDQARANFESQMQAEQAAGAGQITIGAAPEWKDITDPTTTNRNDSWGPGHGYVPVQDGATVIPAHSTGARIEGEGVPIDLTARFSAKKIKIEEARRKRDRIRARNLHQRRLADKVGYIPGKPYSGTPRPTLRQEEESARFRDRGMTELRESQEAERYRQEQHRKFMERYEQPPEKPEGPRTGRRNTLEQMRNRRRYSAGGAVDSVPAMLTPGEFVVNAEAAQKNLGLLHAINNTPVQKFAKGGPVRRYRDGGENGKGGFFGGLFGGAKELSTALINFNSATPILASALQNFNSSDLAGAMNNLANSSATLYDAATQIANALQSVPNIPAAITASFSADVRLTNEPTLAGVLAREVARLLADELGNQAAAHISEWRVDGSPNGPVTAGGQK